MNDLTLQQFFAEKKHPSFRLKQVRTWLYRQGVLEFDQMSNLPLTLRDELKDALQPLSIEIIRRLDTADQQTSKFLLRLGDGKITEMVIIRHAKGRRTLCVSSQVGCPVGCSFCATGQMGFARHLTAEEIFDQILLARSILIKEVGGEAAHLPTNVVFMGMGEPFLNYDNVMDAVNALHQHLQLGGRRVTVSTSGVVPRIDDFAKAGLQVNLAVSLHAVTDELRDVLVPLNRTYPLAELRRAIQHYLDKTNRKVFYEYVMLNEVNDTPEQAQRMVEWLPPKLSHVNLIPYNTVPGVKYTCSTLDRVKAFQQRLEAAGFPVTVRFNMGNDVNAACGQLASEEARAHVKQKRRLKPAPTILDADQR